MTVKYLGLPPRRAHAGGTAGNQSSLSYNAAKGVPGYTGYCPSEHALPPTAKTAVNTRAPQDRPLDPEAVEHTLALEQGGQFESM